MTPKIRSELNEGFNDDILLNCMPCSLSASENKNQSTAMPNHSLTNTHATANFWDEPKNPLYDK